MQTWPRKTACSPLHPFNPWTRVINPVMQKWPHIRYHLMHQMLHNIASQAWSFLLLSAPPTPLPIYPWAQLLLLLPRRFISAPPPFNFDWCQGTAHCTHKTCQARIIHPTPISTALTYLYGLSCIASHTIMSLLPNSRWLAKICVWRISSSLSPTTSRLCLGMKIIL